MEDLIKHLKGEVEEANRRVAILEVQREADSKNIDRMTKEIMEIRQCVQRIEVAQAERNAKPMCPAPGLCNELKEQLTETANIVNSLAESRAEARGAWKTIVAAAAVVGALSGFASSWIGSIIHRGHTP